MGRDTPAKDRPTATRSLSSPPISGDFFNEMTGVQGAIDVEVAPSRCGENQLLTASICH